MSDDPHRFVDVLEAEQRDLEALLLALDDAEWAAPTPAEGWDVRDQVSHLADTEEVARDTVTGGPRTLAVEVSVREPDGLIEFGVGRGRQRSGSEVRAWWMEAAERNRGALRSADVSVRVPWGLGMSWRTFVTARLMEHWAHGLDIRAGLGRPAPDTDRLEHVGWICHGALPYAFHVAGVEPPPGRTLRVDVTGPSGESWSYGPADATDRLTGPAGVWCRRAVQRLSADEVAGELVADGPLAALALRHARAFL